MNILKNTVQTILKITSESLLNLSVFLLHAQGNPHDSDRGLTIQGSLIIISDIILIFKMVEMGEDSEHERS